MHCASVVGQGGVRGAGGAPMLQMRGGGIFNNRLVLNGLTGDNIWFFFERASAEAGAGNQSGCHPQVQRFPLTFL